MDLLTGMGTVDLTSLSNMIISVAAMIMVGLVSLGLKLLAQKLGVDSNSKAMNDLRVLTEEGINFAANKAKESMAGKAKVEMDNVLLATTINYISKNGQYLLQKTGYDEKTIADFVVSQIVKNTDVATPFQPKPTPELEVTKK